MPNCIFCSQDISHNVIRMFPRPNPSDPSTYYHDVCADLAENTTLRKHLNSLRVEIETNTPHPSPALSFNHYASSIHGTAFYPRQNENIEYPALGLGGETGEILEEVKKMIRDDGGILTPERRQRIKLEVGDVLWYLNRMAIECGFTLEDAAFENIDKLKTRHASNPANQAAKQLPGTLTLSPLDAMGYSSVGVSGGVTYDQPFPLGAFGSAGATIQTEIIKPNYQ